MRRWFLLALVLAGCSTAPAQRPVVWRCYLINEEARVDQTVDCVCSDREMRCWTAE